MCANVYMTSENWKTNFSIRKAIKLKLIKRFKKIKTSFYFLTTFTL